jgi:HAD superfamily hydrolase (TIGR01509 family)
LENSPPTEPRTNNPESREAWIIRGDNFLALKSFAEALKAFDNAIKNDPKDPSVWHKKGICHLFLNSPWDAIGAYDKIIEINPAFVFDLLYATAFDFQAKKLLGQKKFDAALNAVKTARRIDCNYRESPEFSEAWNNLGIRYVQGKEYEKALNAVTKAFTLDPDFLLNPVYKEIWDLFKPQISMNRHIQDAFESAFKPKPPILSPVKPLPSKITESPRLKQPASHPSARKQPQYRYGILIDPNEEDRFAELRKKFKFQINEKIPDVNKELERSSSGDPEKNKTDLPNNPWKPWTPKDDELLIELFNKGLSLSEMSNSFQRTKDAIIYHLMQNYLITDPDFFQKSQADPTLRERTETVTPTENQSRPELKIRCILFDLDQTLMDTSHLKGYRDAGRWNQVHAEIPRLKKNPLIDDLLAELKKQGLLLACVTSSPKDYTRKIVGHFNWQFDAIVAYHDTRNHKPGPDPFLKALDLLQVRPEECIAVGDSAIDLTAAQAAGIPAVNVCWFGVGDENGNPDPSVQTFNSPPEFRQHCRTDRFYRSTPPEEETTQFAGTKKCEDLFEDTIGQVFKDPQLDQSAEQNSIISLGPYYPLIKNHQNNLLHGEFSSKILNLKNIDSANEKLAESGLKYVHKRLDKERIQFYVNEIRKMLSDTYELTVCVMPKSKQCREPSGIRCIAEQLVNDKITNGTFVIRRIVDQEAKHRGGDRSYEHELASLEAVNSELIQDCIVLLLDDVTTTGNSLRAGKSLLLSHHARRVIMFALGKTSD